MFSRLQWRWVVLLAVAAVALAAMYQLTPDQVQAMGKEADEVYTKVQQFIGRRDEFRSLQIKFPPREERFVHVVEPNRYDVAGFFELEQGGKVVKREYYAKLHRNGRNWALLELEVM